MNNDIAIIGLAGRFPGARNVREFWRNLAGGVESVRWFTDEELLQARVPRRLLQDPRYVKAGLVLDDLEMFDAEFFGFSPKEAAIMDPQHRHFLECAWEALEDAGHPPSRFKGAVGVYAGCGMGAYFAYNVLRNRELLDTVGLFLLRHTGNDKDFLATRASYCFDLKGPSINIQTACSTSLVAVHYACQALLNGEVDMALAGGVTIEVPHRQGYLFAEGEILSPDGHCRAFDHRAAGTLFGSGTGVVVLRRLADAVLDRDQIWAVIKGSAVNNDGAGKVGYLAPSVDGQAAAVAEALAIAQVEPRAVDYIECHGTGTAMGDPIEVAALQQAFAAARDRQFCGLGSVKTNIGHLDTAAGTASLIKVCLALRHGLIPPSLNYEAPNPQIDFAHGPFYVNTAPRPWPRTGRVRRAGVNSLGVGGTNAHVIVEEAPQQETVPVKVAAAQPEPGHHLLAVSARNTQSLDQACQNLAAWLEQEPATRLGDVAFTLGVGRTAFQKRRVCFATDAADAIKALRGETVHRLHTHTATDGAKVAFLLPGGGAQYRHMARGLYRTDAVFREHVDRGLQLLHGKLDVDLREVWLGDAIGDADVERHFDRPSVQLPAIFLCEYALAQSWIARSVQPAALLGHSLGENTAACLAGTFRFEDALQLVLLRGRLFERVEGGGMLAVPLSPQDLQPYLAADLDLAVQNGPGLVVVSGTTAALDGLQQRLAAKGIEAQRVRIAIAAHSRLLEPILAEFAAFLRSIPLRAPAIPFLSNHTGTWIEPQQAQDPGYWVEHLRSTVRFADDLAVLLADPAFVFLEVGPGRTLSSLVRQQPGWSAERSAIPSLRHPDEHVCDVAFLTQAHGRLWAAGVDVDLAVLVDRPQYRRIALPAYAFRHQPYWIEADQPQAAAATDHGLERIADLANWAFVPAWVPDEVAATGGPGEGPFLVFADDAGCGDAVVAALRGGGHAVTSVRIGDAYARLGPDEFLLSPEMGREGYDALLRDLAAEGRAPKAIVHAWLCTKDRGFRPGSSFFHRCQEQGFFSLFFLAQALAGDEGAAPRLFVLANGLAGPAGSETMAEKATVLGPALVIPRELADVHCAVVDVPLPRKRSAAAIAAHWRQVAETLLPGLAVAHDGVLALRDGRFLLRRHVPATPLAPVGPLPRSLRQRGVYLITGGFGGIGSLIAEWLAGTANARLVLVGRRALPPRGQWDRWLQEQGANDPVSSAIQLVRRLESMGAEVEAVAADVANVVELRAGLQAAQRRFQRIDGVFHAAGVVDDDLIAQKDQARVEEVLAPKVQGALVLAEILQETPPDFMVLLSSTSAVLGPAGQVDYVAANSFLDAFARQRTARGLPTVALQWGVWNGVGMTEAMHRGSAIVGRPQRAGQPLFDELQQIGSDQWLLRAEFGCETHWLLAEHRTAEGHALVPGTGMVEMAAEALRAVGEPKPFELRDLYFFRPLHVPDGEQRPVRCRLRRSIEGFEFAVQSESVLDDGRRGWQTHAQARLLLHDLRPPAPLDLAQVAAACPEVAVAPPGEALRTGQYAHLRFGKRFFVLRETRLSRAGQGQGLARLWLHEQFADEAGRFVLHPALLDIATGWAMDLVPGYDGRQLWVPLSYHSVRVHGPLGREVVSHVRRCRPAGDGGGIVGFDLCLCAPDGRVLVEVDGLLLKRVTGHGFVMAPVATAAELEFPEAADGIGSPAGRLLAETVQNGIRPAEGMAALARVLDRREADGGLPAEITISSLPLAALAARMAAVGAAAPSGARFQRPDLDSDYEAPRDDVERTLVQLWEELLGVQKVGVKDDFFDLGGHSLIAVRLFAKIRKVFQVDYPISVLFDAPTVEKCGALLKRDRPAAAGAAATAAASAEGRSEAPRARRKHLVAMGQGVPERTPFFLVAGMFGNVLNLRHLAQLLGADRPFYGLQARGLFGDMAPHATFEEAAVDYLAELRQVQPHGPYLLGGFSGGGITAYEMARQLRTAGEAVAMLVLLDTPLPLQPRLTRGDRLRIQAQNLRRGGLGYLGRWAQSRWRWELGKLRRRLGLERRVEAATAFHNQTIEAAFRASLQRYTVEPQDVRTWLFRPALDRHYDLGHGRFATRARELVRPDNGWTPYVPELRVVEVPGDHDSMVLEPNVRSLARYLREAIAAVETVAPATEGAARDGREISRG